jgi:thymidine kinase
MVYIELHIGPMFSGKTTALNNIASRTIAVGHRVELWLPTLSAEGQENALKNDQVSLLHPQVTVRKLTDEQLTAEYIAHLTPHEEEVGVVLIDEVHFFNDKILFNFFRTMHAHPCAYQHAHFFCFGLTGTYKLTPWPTINTLIPLAVKIRHYRAICAVCGRPTLASFTRMLHPDATQLIDSERHEGGSDVYQAVCENCIELATN